MKKMKTVMAVLCMMVMVFGVVPNVSALTIDANIYDVATYPNGDDNTWWAGYETGQSAIDLIIASIIPGTYMELYKMDYDDNKESGDLAASYKTTFTGDPNNALIEYEGGPYIGPPPVYVLVKDGNATPSWYLFRTMWNGTDDLELLNFWNGPGGAISHVTLYGTSTQVPEPTTLLLLGLGLVGIAGIRRGLKK